jgi:hypothetical protein
VSLEGPGSALHLMQPSPLPVTRAGIAPACSPGTQRPKPLRDHAARPRAGCVALRFGVSCSQATHRSDLLSLPWLSLPPAPKMLKMGKYAAAYGGTRGGETELQLGMSGPSLTSSN